MPRVCRDKILRLTLRCFKSKKMEVFNNLKGFLKFSILDKFPSVLNFVTTKQNPYGHGSEFNIGYSGGSDEETLRNRVVMALSLNLEPDNFVIQTQSHKDNYKIVTSTDRGSGFFSKETAVQGTDILLTNVKNLCLITRSADCTPVLLYSPDVEAVAAVHSGREGTFLGVAAKAAKLLKENFGADFSKMIACIGPAIGKECYEVGYDCAEKFFKNPRFSDNTISQKGEKYFLDLKTMIFEDLTALGLKASNIEKSTLCTKCEDKKFFSARRGESQRFCAGIMLK